MRSLLFLTLGINRRYWLFLLIIILNLIGKPSMAQSGTNMSDAIPIVINACGWSALRDSQYTEVGFSDNYGYPTPDVWYRFTVSSNADISISTCNSDFDTYLYLLDVNGNLIASDDEGSVCGMGTSEINRTVGPGTYYIVAEAWGYGPGGSLGLDFFAHLKYGGIPFPGGDLSNSFDAGSFSGSGSYTDTRNNGDMCSDSNIGNPSNDIYYKFTLMGESEVTLSHCGTGFSSHMLLLDGSGSVEIANSFNKSDPNCPGAAYIKIKLPAGIYYLVSEGDFLDVGNIVTNISVVETPKPSLPVISYNGSSYFTTGTPVSMTPVNTGGAVSPSNAYSIDPALPAGLMFNTADGTISGIPTVVSALTVYTISAGNSAGYGTTTLDIEVKLKIEDTSACPALSQDQNYVVTYVVKEAGLTSASAVVAASCYKTKVQTSIQYFDGIGRPLQTVQVKGNGDGTRDLIQPIAYDLVGRESTKYLPYTSDAGTVGSYRSNALVGSNGYSNSAQKTFYEQSGQGYKAVSSPYAVTVYEPSPLSRVMEQGSPGDVWQPGLSRSSSGGRTSVIEYGTNNTSTDYASTGYAVRYYRAEAVTTIGSEHERILSGTAYYPNGSLYRTISKDENWVMSDGKAGTVEEYKDKLGHLVLKRTFNRKDDGSIETLSTYYVYDDLGNLSFVLPPAAEPDAAVIPDQNKLNYFCYQYRYDGRKRLIEKKIPGKDLWESLVYNPLNKVVLSQDGVQLGNGKWLFTKYDGFGRIIMTGQLANGSTRAAMQEAMDSHVAGNQLLFEIRESNTGTGYTNQSFPNSNIELYYTINYYDDYDFNGNIFGQPNSSFGQVGAINTIGLLTGSRVAVLGTGTMLQTVNYYDQEGRIIQSKSQHYKGGNVSSNNYDEISNAYSFTGELKESIRRHYIGGIESLYALNQYTYDHMGRKIESKQKTGNNSATHNPLVLLSRNTYNEIGQLLKKELHSTNGTSFLQSTGYAYNERGWLKSSLSDQFSFQLNYNDASSTASPQFNGNISNQLWGSGLSMPNTFSYKYDKLNRLVDGTSTGIVMSESLTYDVMGNIKSLSRGGGAGNIYNYTGNRLNTVDNVTLMPYQYDANGNAKTDGRNGMVLTYNYLNLPQSAGNGSVNVTYTYDANGKKLSKQSNTTGRTDYVDGIQYKPDGTIEFVQTEEGVARRNGGGYSYEYNLTDHLGNVRYSFHQDPSSLSLERLQSDDYYAFGKRKSSGSPVSLNNKYLYNSKELQDELGSLNEEGQLDYGARFYDPVIGRWNMVDPLAEKHFNVNPYNYVLNNPINFIDPFGLDTVPVNKIVENKPEARQFNPEKDEIALNPNAVVIRPQFNMGTGETQGTLGAAVPLALTSSAIDGPLPIGEAVGASVLTAAAVYDAMTRVYVTYTLTGPGGKVYVGRSSGFGDPQSIMMNRYAGHHMRAFGYGNPKLDRSAVGYPAGYYAIRGREQDVVVSLGGIGSPRVGNSINPIWQYNPNKPIYLGASKLMFGPIL